LELNPDDSNFGIDQPVAFSSNGPLQSVGFNRQALQFTTRDFSPMSRSATLDRLKSRVPVIAPSMLKCDFGNLHREVELLDAAGAVVLHLDVMDGHFVPNLSYGPMVIERLRPMTQAIFDAHLMISDPDRFLDEYLKAGCDAITFHFEAVPEAGPLLRRIKDADVVAGLAINPGTPVERIEKFLPDCDQVLVMSVEPGFGGQKFIPNALEKLRQLRQMTPPETLLSVDGGIGPATIADCAAAGAELFVVGSAIFDEVDYGVAIQELAKSGSRHASSST
jgi:ribulose-phosphate 3-epimerase